MKHFVILKPQATSFNCPSDLNIFYSRHKWKWKLFKLAGFTSCPTKVKVLTNLTFGHKPIDRGGKGKISPQDKFSFFFQPGFHWLTQGLNLTAASELEIWGTCDHFPDFTPHRTSFSFREIQECISDAGWGNFLHFIWVFRPHLLGQRIDQPPLHPAIDPEAQVCQRWK